jgi:hypothetical protein
MRYMKRTAAILMGLVLATAVAASCAASAHKPSPTLTLASRNPVVVSGHHFTPRRKVHLVVTATRTQSRAVTANRQGTFTAAFATVIDRCTSWSVTATQPGHAPVVIRGAKPQCPPA